MRTTVELSQAHRQALHQLAQMRGFRGYSRIVGEAVDFFVENRHFDKKEQSRLLRLKGSWKDSEAQKIRSAVREVRVHWTK